MRRFILFILATLYFSLFLSLSTTTYAAQFCATGRPEAGRGGAVGDKCTTAFDDCCKTPDGDNSKSLVCDGRPNSATQNTCILLTNFGGEGSECLDNNYCDGTKGLQCVNKKCAKAACAKVNAACNTSDDCCANQNLFCDRPPVNSATGTCKVKTTCANVNAACNTNADCCGGQHLSCDPDSKKCVSACATAGQACTSTQTGAPGSCCGDQDLTCDIDRIVEPEKGPQCVTQTELKSGRKKLNGPTIPPPPSPPCANKTDGKCTSVQTAFGEISTDPSKFITQIYGIILSASGAIAVLLFMRAGYKIQTSRGNPEAIKEGSEQATAVAVGLLFLILAFVILQIIAGDLLKIPGIK